MLNFGLTSPLSRVPPHCSRPQQLNL